MEKKTLMEIFFENSFKNIKEKMTKNNFEDTTKNFLNSFFKNHIFILKIYLLLFLIQFASNIFIINLILKKNKM